MTKRTPPFSPEVRERAVQRAESGRSDRWQSPSAFPRGSSLLSLRDGLGPIFDDWRFRSRLIDGGTERILFGAVLDVARSRDLVQGSRHRALTG